MKARSTLDKQTGTLFTHDGLNAHTGVSKAATKRRDEDSIDRSPSGNDKTSNQKSCESEQDSAMAPLQLQLQLQWLIGRALA